jgi:cysteine desulfurase/selenocysteine lyase
MIATVTFERSTYAGIPERFEAGTPHIAGAVGLAAALAYLQAIGLDRIAVSEHDVLDYACRQLRAIPRVRVIGAPDEQASAVSFLVDGVHPHDVATVLDREGVAIRTGHHCAQPLLRRLGLTATARASFALYNTRADVDVLVAGIHKTLEVLG